MTGEPVLAAMGTVAVRQGKVAGINAVGGTEIYRGTVLTRVNKPLIVAADAVARKLKKKKKKLL